jgi:hypothetical protein
LSMDLDVILKNVKIKIKTYIYRRCANVMIWEDGIHNFLVLFARSR